MVLSRLRVIAAKEIEKKRRARPTDNVHELLDFLAQSIPSRPTQELVQPWSRSPAVQAIGKLLADPNVCDAFRTYAGMPERHDLPLHQAIASYLVLENTPTDSVDEPTSLTSFQINIFRLMEDKANAAKAWPLFVGAAKLGQHETPDTVRANATRTASLSHLMLDVKKACAPDTPYAALGVSPVRDSQQAAQAQQPLLAYTYH